MSGKPQRITFDRARTQEESKPSSCTSHESERNASLVGQPHLREHGRKYGSRYQELPSSPSISKRPSGHWARFKSSPCFKVNVTPTSGVGPLWLGLSSENVPEATAATMAATDSATGLPPESPGPQKWTLDTADTERSCWTPRHTSLLAFTPPAQPEMTNKAEPTSASNPTTASSLALRRIRTPRRPRTLNREDPPW